MQRVLRDTRSSGDRRPTQQDLLTRLSAARISCPVGALDRDIASSHARELLLIGFTHNRMLLYQPQARHSPSSPSPSLPTYLSTPPLNAPEFVHTINHILSFFPLLSSFSLRFFWSSSLTHPLPPSPPSSLSLDAPDDDNAFSDATKGQEQRTSRELKGTPEGKAWAKGGGKIGIYSCRVCRSTSPPPPPPQTLLVHKISTL